MQSLKKLSLIGCILALIASGFLILTYCSSGSWRLPFYKSRPAATRYGEVEQSNTQGQENAPRTPALPHIAVESARIRLEEQFRALRKDLNALLLTNILARTVVADLPNYCAYVVEPLTNSQIAELVSQAALIVTAARPDVEGFAKEYQEHFQQLLEESSRYARVEAMIDVDGTVSWSITRMDSVPPPTIGNTGRWLYDGEYEKAQYNAAYSAALYGPYFADLYGQGMPDKIRAAMKDLENSLPAPE